MVKANHAAGGEGYLFLAARLTAPLTYWRRYEPKRQTLMRAQLERILRTENLSRDVFEIVRKSLDVEILSLSRDA